jgi:arylsulfatase A-like enzyme
MHAPHHAPTEWIDRQRGKFDDGWDAWRRRAFERQVELGIVPAGTKLPERPSWVDAWDDVPAEHRRLFARQMEAFAGFLEHTDHQIGRVLTCLAEQGLLDDTIVMVLSDNGTSAEGGPVGTFNEHRFTHDIYDDPDETLARIDEIGGPCAYNHYAWGWAWAGNAPLRLWKRYSWLGGVRTPLVVHWPRRIEARGEVRDQFCHAIDLMPTLLDAAGIDEPAEVDGVGQQRVDGRSLVGTFADGDAPSPRDTQYFEMVGSRAIYHDGWKATTDHVGQQLQIEVQLLEGSLSFDDDHWALFDLRNDFAEADDVSEQHPDVARRLVELWWAEAGANQVLPLDDSFIGRAIAIEPPPFRVGFRTTYTPGGGPISEDLLPPIGGGARILADVEVPDTGARGIVCALGDWNNGWAVYLLEGRPVAAFNLFSTVYRTASDAPLPGGRHVVGVEYVNQPPGGRVTLLVNDAPVGEVQLASHLPFRWQIGNTGLRIGDDRGFPVCDDYRPPFAFSGTVHSVTFEVPSLARPEEDEAARRVARAMRHE